MPDRIEKSLISLLECCGFRYEPGTPLGPNEGFVEVVPIPYEEFEHGVVPGWWLRVVDLHLGDTWTACTHVAEHFLNLGVYFRKGIGAVAPEWLDDYLPVTVSDELRLHVFCFLVYSETIRDKMRSASWASDEAVSFVPFPDKRSRRSPISVKSLSAELVRRGCASEDGARWVSRQLARLDAHCRWTESAIDEFVSQPDGAVWNMANRFANVQAAFTELARVLLDADVAVDIYSHCDFGSALDR